MARKQKRVFILGGGAALGAHHVGAMRLLEEQGIAAHLLSDFFQNHLAHSQAARLQGIHFISLHSAPVRGWHTEAKRLFDLLAAAALLVACLPLFGLVALILKLSSPGPVFFIQERMGYNKRRFQLFKFRTMVVRRSQRMQHLLRRQCLKLNRRSHLQPHLPRPPHPPPMQQLPPTRSANSLRRWTAWRSRTPATAIRPINLSPL